MKADTLYTDRLILRPFREGDEQAMFNNWVCDERVARYCRWYAHKDIEETLSYLKTCLNADYCWAITLKGQDEPVGAIDIAGKNSAGVYEVGYVLSYRYWGQGIMTETLSAVINELFRCGFDKVGACHDVNNPASGRVMEKCGMKYVGTAKARKKFGSDELCDVKCYEISRKDG